MHRISLMTLAAALLIASMARGQAPATSTAPVLDPKADAVIKKMADYYKGMKTAAADVESSMKVTGAGQNQLVNSSTSIKVERPNKLAVTVKEQQTGGGTVVSDGKQFSMHIPQLQKYAQDEAPETMDELIESPVAALAQHASIVLTLFASDPYKHIIEGVEKSTYVGAEEIDGKKYDHIHLQQDEIDFDFWVEQGDKPVLRRVKPNLDRQLKKAAAQQPQLQGMTFEASVDVKEWKIDQALAADAFAFKPPEGVAKAASMEALFGGGEEKVHPLEGKAAPDLTLDLLKGGQMKLADHKGKDVVVLDFWATWCPPCVKGLPVVSEVSNSFAAKNVVFYAINEEEAAEKIEPFLKEQKLEALKVALDKDGKAGQAYFVQGIPQTVIIGKDGMVKSVHTGFGMGVKRKLQKELEALSSGKELPQKSAPPAATPG